MKKILSLALALALVLTLFTGVSFADEKRVLSIASTRDYEKEFKNGVFTEIADALGCEIQFTQYDNDSFAALLAGGQLADIIMNGQMISDILDSGLALNVDPYLDEYAPSMKSEYVQQAFDLSRQLMSRDGGLYLLPPALGLHNYQYGGAGDLTRGYVLRWDYYKELGCPEIKNDDDFIDVMLKMLELHPTTEDGTPSMLYGVEKSFGDMGGYRSAFKSDIALNTWCFKQYKGNVITGEIVDGYLDVEHSRYWDDMAFQNKIYRLGLYDTDSFTMTGDEWSAKVAKGQYMGLYWRSSSFYKANKEIDPETTVDYVVIPSSGMLNYININMIVGNMPDYWSFIWKDSQNIDLALGFFNYMYDIDFARYMYSGKQGETWDYDENGVPYMFPEALEAIARNDDYWTSEGGGHGKRYGGFGGYNPAQIGSDGYPLNLTLTRDVAIQKQTALQRDIAATYGVEYYMDAYNAVEKDFRNDICESVSACVTNISAADKRVLEECESIMTAGMATLIMSETEEEFEQNKAEILEELEETGEAEVFARYQEEWNKVRDIIQPLQREMSIANGFEPYPAE